MSEKWTQIGTALELNQNDETSVKVLYEFRTYPSDVTYLPLFITMPVQSYYS